MTAWRLGYLLPYNIRKEVKNMSNEDKRFLQILHNPELRASLLERLEELELLSSFLAVEHEATQDTFYPIQI